MRSKQEMMDLILHTAEDNNAIRAVYMNGSRTNPIVLTDIFQDYDIVYVVKDTQVFINDDRWLAIFGKCLYTQKPDAMDKALQHPCNHQDHYAWLMQFSDGNRIDLQVQSIPYAKQVVEMDSLCEILLDKDQILPALPKSSDVNYWIKKPSMSEFLCCCNEFWWLQNNIGKGLWREEVTYVLDMHNFNVRPQLLQLLTWYAGSIHGFHFSAGKSAKYLANYLPDEVWTQYLQTYTIANIDELWNASYLLCDLFDNIARKLSQYFVFQYNVIEANNSLAFLKHTQTLPKDTNDI